jgi:CcmD family protein
VKNFWYLFAAYTVIWTAMFSYIVGLSRKNKALRDELAELREQVQQHLTRKETA